LSFALESNKAQAQTVNLENLETLKADSDGARKAKKSQALLDIERPRRRSGNRLERVKILSRLEEGL